MSAPIEIPLRSARVLLNLGVVAALAGACGIALLVGEATGHHSTGQRVGGSAFGGLLVVVAALFALAAVVTARARALVVDTEGLRWVTSRGGWRVRWSELATVAVHTGLPVGDHGRRQRTRVHLVLTTDDPGFRARHHEFDGLRGRFSDSDEGRVGIPFADRRDLVEPIDAALRTFAGHRYRAVVDDGRLSRPGYRPEPGDDRPAW